MGACVYGDMTRRRRYRWLKHEVFRVGFSPSVRVGRTKPKGRDHERRRGCYYAFFCIAITIHAAVRNNADDIIRRAKITLLCLKFKSKKSLGANIKRQKHSLSFSLTVDGNNRLGVKGFSLQAPCRRRGVTSPSSSAEKRNAKHRPPEADTADAEAWERRLIPPNSRSRRSS